MLSFLILFLHITTMFAAVSVSIGFSTILLLAERTGQMAIVRGVAVAGRPLGIATAALFVLGGLFGLVTAFSFGFNLLAPWLVIAYVLWTIATLSGIGIHRPFRVALAGALATAPDGPIAGPVATLLADSRERVATILDYAIIAALIFDMVAKPFT